MYIRHQSLLLWSEGNRIFYSCRSSRFSPISYPSGIRIGLLSHFLALLHSRHRSSWTRIVDNPGSSWTGHYISKYPNQVDSSLAVWTRYLSTRVYIPCSLLSSGICPGMHIRYRSPTWGLLWIEALCSLSRILGEFSPSYSLTGRNIYPLYLVPVKWCYWWAGTG